MERLGSLFSPEMDLSLHRTGIDVEFEAELRKRQARLAELEALSLRHRAYDEPFHKALYDLLELFQFNTSFLAPYFWPNYPKNKPLGFADYPFSFNLFDIHVGGYTVIRGSRQIAKSTSFSCRQQMVARMLPGFRSLYITPRRDQLQTYQNK